jgi:uncharacterized protein YbgA (DUF1722 family)/uncharacterized protein YbbK (DUF523 family)
MMEPTIPPTVRIGISACLVGQEVRYNGGHLNDSFLIETLTQHVEWIPICPEVETGMGVPREQIRLVGNPSAPKLIAPRSGTDHTSKMLAWADGKVKELANAQVDGFVLTKGSPSCGLFRVRVYQEKEGTPPTRQGVGMFARALTEQMPNIPAEEDGRLHDPRIRENFVERIFMQRRWREMLETTPGPKGLVAFHTAHKLTFMAHSNTHYRELGRLVANSGRLPWSQLLDQYTRLMGEGMRLIATPKKQTNVLHHLMGFLKNSLSPDDKVEMLELISDYRVERLPIIVPLTLLKHHLRRFAVPDWVHQQAYLNPYPQELALRNHV